MRVFVSHTSSSLSYAVFTDLSPKFRFFSRYHFEHQYSYTIDSPPTPCLWPKRPNFAFYLDSHSCLRNLVQDLYRTLIYVLPPPALGARVLVAVGRRMTIARTFHHGQFRMCCQLDPPCIQMLRSVPSKHPHFNCGFFGQRHLLADNYCRSMPKGAKQICSLFYLDGAHLFPVGLTKNSIANSLVLFF